AIAVFGTFCVVISWASRSSAQTTPLESPDENGASCTNRNGKSPSPQFLRQSWIMAGNSVRYWYARPAFDSPWYQIAPLTEYGISGAIMPLYRPLALLLGLPSGQPGICGGAGAGLFASLAAATAALCLSRFVKYPSSCLK